MEQQLGIKHLLELPKLNLESVLDDWWSMHQNGIDCVFASCGEVGTLVEQNDTVSWRYGKTLLNKRGS
jgi:hypothetical protein